MSELRLMVIFGDTFVHVYLIWFDLYFIYILFMMNEPRISKNLGKENILSVSFDFSLHLFRVKNVWIIKNFLFAHQRCISIKFVNSQKILLNLSLHHKKSKIVEIIFKRIFTFNANKTFKIIFSTHFIHFLLNLWKLYVLAMMFSVWSKRSIYFTSLHHFPLDLMFLRFFSIFMFCVELSSCSCKYSYNIVEWSKYWN